VVAFVGDSGTPESLAQSGYNKHLHFEIRVGDSFLGVGLPMGEVRALYEAVARSAYASPTPKTYPLTTIMTRHPVPQNTLPRPGELCPTRGIPVVVSPRHRRRDLVAGPARRRQEPNRRGVRASRSANVGAGGASVVGEKLSGWPDFLLEDLPGGEVR
jgi:hypothetical protein